MRLPHGFVWPLLLMIAHAGALPGTPVSTQPVAVRIVRPQADTTVEGPDLVVELEVDGVVLGGRARNGAYALLTLDDVPPVKSFARRFTFRRVEAGSHRLVVELLRSDGTRFEPEARASVRFATAPRATGQGKPAGQAH